MDKSNDIKQLREQMRKLDERLDSVIQVLDPIPKCAPVSDVICADEGLICV